MANPFISVKGPNIPVPVVPPFEDFGVLTQQEYDALDNDKKENGIWFVPPEHSEASAPGSASSNVYSAEETVVGTWFGKPLYRLAFEVTTPSGDLGYYPLPASVKNDTESVVSIRGTMSLTNGTRVSLGFHDTFASDVSNTTQSGVFIYYNLSQFGIRLKGNLCHNRPGFVVIEYTKKTDTADSDAPAFAQPEEVT